MKDRNDIEELAYDMKENGEPRYEPDPDDLRDLYLTIPSIQRREELKLEERNERISKIMEMIEDYARAIHSFNVKAEPEYEIISNIRTKIEGQILALAVTE